MPAIKFDNFLGRIPRLSSQNLPPNAATVARNLRLLSGNLRALGVPAVVDFEMPQEAYIAKYAFPVNASTIKDDPDDDQVENTYPFVWVPYQYIGTSVHKGPVVRDRFERYYWTDEGQAPPRYTTRKYMHSVGRTIDNSGQNPLHVPEVAYVLGVPTPTSTPTGIPTATGTQNDETRSYVYTFVSVYGEEGPPSPSSTPQTGDPASNWDITLPDTAVPGRDPTIYKTKRLYRSQVTSTGTASFRFVADVDLNVTAYTDAGGSDVSTNNELESTDWFPPPAELDGLVSHPNGFFAGFAGFDIYFSEPFRPHAWPDRYTLSLDVKIVSMAVIETSIVVMTEGSPHVISGILPDSLTLTKIETVEPCVSRYSHVVMPDGVYYASGNGIARVVAERVEVVSQLLIDARTWREQFSPETIVACRDHEYYMAFFTDGEGFFLTPADPTNSIIDLDGFSGVVNHFSSRLNGEVYLLGDDNRLRQWDPPNSTSLTYQWRSKEIVFPKPCNMGACKIDFDATPKTPGDDLSAALAYNEAELAKSVPLHPLNYDRLGYAPGSNNRLPLGGSTLFNIADIGTITGSAQLLVYSRDKLLFSNLLVSEAVRKLPATLRSDKWSWELIANTSIFYLAVAESGKQLQNV